MYIITELLALGWFLIVGVLLGLTANFLVNGSKLGIWWDMGGGVLGAFLASFFVHHINMPLIGFWGILGISVLGAALFIVLLRFFSFFGKTQTE